MPTPTILSYFRPIARRPALQEEQAEAEAEADREEGVKAPKRAQRMQQSAKETSATVIETTEPSGRTNRVVEARSDGNDKAPPADKKTDNGVSEYEQKRLARMAENAAFLAQMGMKNTQLALASHVQSSAKASKERETSRTAAKRKRAVLAAESDGDGGLRRSSRLRKLPAETDEAAQRSKSANDVEENDNANMLELFFDDSSVLQYTCQASTNSSGDSAEPGLSPRATGRSLVGFEQEDHRVAPPLFDSKLKKIYAVSFSPFADNALLVAAGHQGHVSVYAARSQVGTPESDEQGPLLSFKAHKGWISSVSLAKSSPGGQRNLLLTASNDSLVKLWDLNQVTALSASSMPKMVFQSDKLHSAGIFSMDVLQDSVATGSKDSTITISEFRDDGVLSVVHCYADQHDGVVKSVHWSRQSPRRVASGGNDRVLRVFDTHVKECAVVEIANAHARAINSVQFHPSDANLVVSAGFDADMHLFDLRRPSTPLFTFRGHLVDGKQHSAIYHPVFVDGGRGLAAAAGAHCRHISLYNVQDGRTVSRGAIVDRPDVLSVDSFADRLLVGSAGSLEFYRFKWA